MKQGCALAPTLFGIYFAMVLREAFDDRDEGVYIHARSYRKLLHLARLRARIKTRSGD